MSGLDAAVLSKAREACDHINQLRAREIARSKRFQKFFFAGAIAIMVFPWLNPFVRVGLVIVYVVGVTLWHVRGSSDINNVYKGIVVPRMVAALGRGLTYKRNASLTSRELADSELFPPQSSGMRIEDEVRGSKNGVGYFVNEVTAYQFFGLVVRLDFNKNFAGHTVVVYADDDDPLSSSVVWSDVPRDKPRVTLESADFERRFHTYSTNDQEARYLLTPKLMELAVEARERYGSMFRFAFYRNSMFVAVPKGGNRFDVKYWKDVTPADVVEDLAEVVDFAERLIDQFDLETRIWTRV